MGSHTMVGAMAGDEFFVAIGFFVKNLGQNKAQNYYKTVTTLLFNTMFKKNMAQIMTQ